MTPAKKGLRPLFNLGSGYVHLGTAVALRHAGKRGLVQTMVGNRVAQSIAAQGGQALDNGGKKARR